MREFLANGEWNFPRRISLVITRLRNNHEDKGFLSILIQVQDCLAGLKHLHTQKPPICHGNLTPVGDLLRFYRIQSSDSIVPQCNVLVNASYGAMISDFTSTRIRRKATKMKPGQRLIHETGDVPSIHLGVSNCGRYMNLTASENLLQWKAPELLSGEQPDLPADVWNLGWIVCEVIA